jgi:hypothetical protein
MSESSTFSGMYLRSVVQMYLRWELYSLELDSSRLWMFDYQIWKPALC